MNKEDTDQRMHLLVYPAKDMASAKRLYSELLGVEPHVDSSYYTGCRTGDLEIGIDPNGRHEGPSACWEVDDIRASLERLLDAGGQAVQGVKDVRANGSAEMQSSVFLKQ